MRKYPLQYKITKSVVSNVYIIWLHLDTKRETTLMLMKPDLSKISMRKHQTVCSSNTANINTRLQMANSSKSNIPVIWFICQYKCFAIIVIAIKVGKKMAHYLCSVYLLPCEIALTYGPHGPCAQADVWFHQLTYFVIDYFIMPMCVCLTADEHGFRASGDHIPTAPPIPLEIQKGS